MCRRDGGEDRELEIRIIPIFEPTLEEMVLKNSKAGRLNLTIDLSFVLNDVEVVFSAVGTPPDFS